VAQGDWPVIRVDAIAIDEAPGLPDGVEVGDLAPGLNVVLGPNASGKSTLVRVMLSTLWPSGDLRQLRARVRWESDAGPLQATLRYGDVEWEPAKPQLPPRDVKALLSLDLRSLLEGRSESGADAVFSQRVAVELMSGYDLEGALRSIPKPVAKKGKLQKALQEARRELSSLERETEALAEREDRLAVLRRELHAAGEAAELEYLAQKAAQLKELHTESAQLKARLADFPPGVEKLREDASEELDRGKQAVVEAEDAVAQLQEELDASRAERDALKLLLRPPSEQVAAWRELARRLVDEARELTGAERSLAEAEARMAEARSGLGDWDPPQGELPTESLSTLDRLLSDRIELRARVQVQEDAAAYWDGQAENEASVGTSRHLALEPTSEEDLSEGVNALRAWLRSASGHTAPAWWGWVAFALGVVTLVVAAWGVASHVPASGLSLALLAFASALIGAGAGYLLGLWLVRGRGRGTSRRDAERRAIDAGVVPEKWQQDSVRELLRRSEAELDRLRRRQRAKAKAQEARQALGNVEQQLGQLQRQIEELLDSARLSPELPDLDIIDGAKRVQEWGEARQDVAELQATVTDLRARVASEHEALGAWLSTLGVVGPDDPSSASAALEELSRRLAALGERERHIESLERQLQRAREALRTQQGALDDFWRRSGFEEPDENELRRRLEALPEYTELRGDLNDCNVRAADLEAELQQADAWRRLGLDPDSYTAQQVRELAELHGAAAARRDELLEEITRIEQDVERAKQGTSLEDARAKLAAAAQALADHRDQAMEDALARFLVERARQAQLRQHRPAVLAKAQEWFSTFTHGAFRLEVSRNGALRASDTRTRETRELEQLSDGTRIHLLLAARLAALEETEGAAGPLPVFLDEALSTTDPLRFREIASAIMALTEKGRQVLYLTADPAEVTYWQQACAEAGYDPPTTILLEASAGPAAGWDAVPDLRPGPAIEVPSPNGLDAVSWARLIGVPAPDPARPAAAWHVLHLAPDHLEIVHAVLRRGIEHVGALDQLLAAGRLRSVLGSREIALLKARMALFTAALDLWSRGRGRRVTWSDVEASGAVSSIFEARAKKLVERHGSDPVAFLEQVRALPNFLSRKADVLEDHLRQVGALPDGQLLTPEVIVADAVDRSHEDLESAGAGVEEAAAYVRSLLQLLDTMVEH